MKIPRVLHFLIVFGLFSCSSDSPPAGAVEGRFFITYEQGPRDPDVGRVFIRHVNVVIDDTMYPIFVSQSTRLVGTDPNADLTELSGRSVIVAGEIEAGEYHATYVEFLPLEVVDTVSEGEGGSIRVPDLPSNDRFWPI